MISRLIYGIAYFINKHAPQAAYAHEEKTDVFWKTHDRNCS